MAFRCDTATLERLEWPRLIERLAGCAATGLGARACRGDLFEQTRAGVDERLAETDEARALIDSEQPLPFHGVADLSGQLENARVGATLPASELARVLSTLEGADRIARFLAERTERAPTLSALAETLPDLGKLVREIAGTVTREGELRDDASPALRRLRKSVREHEQKIAERMNTLLRSSEISPHLQDSYVTSREGRPVLPVRAEARSRVKGIVHDVSSSGTTVFIEPETVVEAGNRLRVAQTELAREIERLLREATEAVRAESAALEAQANTLTVLDLAWARARLSQRLAATSPEGTESGRIELIALRHPLLLLEAGLEAADVIANDFVLPEGVRGLVISGPNAGGKSVAAKALGLAALCMRAGLHVASDSGSRLPVFEQVFADIGDEQDLRAGLSTFSARMSNLARIVSEADSGTLAIVDEIGEGTEPGEGAALAQAILERLVDRGATVIATTHFNRLKEIAGGDARFANASAEFDIETLRPTYRVRIGAPGSSGASWVAERMGLAGDVIERARELMDGEDRRLESLTRDLSELRQELEGERALAVSLREDTESKRRDYEQRIERLRTAREEALGAMKAELEQAYKGARDEIAVVMRELQRSGGADGRAASRATQKVQEIRERARVTEREHAEAPGPAREIDWGSVEEGARLELSGIRGGGTLLEAPDRRGRVVVRAGGARLTLPVARVQRVLAAAPKLARPRLGAAREPDTETSEKDRSCDLRGLRVEEALERAEAHLQAMLGHGVPSVTFIHGHGTGALRSAIRSWLRGIPEVERSEADKSNGATIALLSH